MKKTFTFILFLLAVAFVDLPVEAALDPTANPRPMVDARARDYAFEVLPGLETQVGFWKKIYTEYTTSQAVVHDIDDLNIVYEVVDLDPNKSHFRNELILRSIKNKYRDILLNLAKHDGRSPLTETEKRVAEMVKGRFYSAAHNIRSQLGQKDRFEQGLSRSGMYIERMRKIFSEYGLPEELTALPHVESSFQIGAYSSAGAAGIWQFTRGTGALFLRVGYDVDERRDPIIATHAAARLLALNYDSLHSWPLALTAYNHGLEGMKRAKSQYGDNLPRIINHYQSRSFGFASKNFYTEFLAALEISGNHEKYFPHVRLAAPIPTLSVKLQNYIGIDTAMKYFKMTREEVAQYNPALRPPVLSGARRIPAGFVLKMPAERSHDVTAVANEIPAEQRHSTQVESRWYTVRKGDTVSAIAARFSVNPDQLKNLNKLNDSFSLRMGQVLELPTGGKAVLASYARSDKSASTADEADDYVTHVVKRHENLSSIARAFNTSSTTIREFNHLHSAALHVGQALKIPRSAVVDQALKTSLNPSVRENTAIKKDDDSKSADKEQKTTVTISDDIEKLKGSFKIDIEMAEASTIDAKGRNNKHRPAFLPVSFQQGGKEKHKIGIVTVDFDETISHFADWSGYTIPELQAYNNLSKKAPLQVAQRIKVPFDRKDSAYFENKRLEYHKAIQEDFFNNYRVNKIVVKNVKKGETLWEICNEGTFIPFWLLSNYNPEKDINKVREGDSIVIPVVASSKS